MASRSSSRALCASCRLNSSLWCCKHRLRDELLNGEIFYTLREAQVVIESWRRHYNTIRPHASIGYKPPAPEVFVPAFASVAGCATPTGSAGHAGATDVPSHSLARARRTVEKLAEDA